MGTKACEREPIEQSQNICFKMSRSGQMIPWHASWVGATAETQEEKRMEIEMNELLAQSYYKLPLGSLGFFQL